MKYIITEQQKELLEADFEEYYTKPITKQEKKIDKPYYGRNVIWYGGQKGQVIKLEPWQLYSREDNIFDYDKLKSVKEHIINSDNRVTLRMGHGVPTLVDIDRIKEDIEYSDYNNELTYEMYPRDIFTTGDEDLDKYLVDGGEFLYNEGYVDTDYSDEFIEWVNDYKFYYAKDEMSIKELFKDFYDIVLYELFYYKKEDGEELDEDDIEEIKKLKIGFKEYIKIEKQLKEAIDNEDGDIGSIYFQIRDGNHRTLGALQSGEPYIFINIEDNYMYTLEPEVKKLIVT